MPRPNRPRTIRIEADLAKRISYERERHRMSYDGLADRMTKIGCAIQASAIYKIEKGDPPRRITLNEAVAFAEVFGVPLEDLLVPADQVATKAARKAMVQFDRRMPALERLADEFERLWGEMRATIPSRTDGKGRSTATMSVEQMNWIAATKARLDESLEKIYGQ